MIYEETIMLRWEVINSMSSIKCVTVQDECKRIIKQLKYVNRILIFSVIILTLVNILSSYYIYLTDPEISVKKVVMKIKGEYLGDEEPKEELEKEEIEQGQGLENKKDWETVKDDSKNTRDQNTEQKDELNKVAEELIANNSEFKELPVENIFSQVVIKEGRILVPVRTTAETLGAEVDWNDEKREIIISKDDKEIILQLENNKVYVNGVEYEIDVSAETINNRTLVPLRFIIENFNLTEEINSNEEEGTIENNE